jgi:Fe-S cluster assembly scaffold protein SufB
MTKDKSSLVQELLQSIGLSPHQFSKDVARLEIHQNQVVGAHLVPGLKVDVDENPDGVAVRIRVEDGVTIPNPVHICFGILPEKGRQKVDMDVGIGENATASILAHCTFPNAVDVVHAMEADITVGPGANYSYFERHVHGPHGGVLVVPNAKVTVHDGGRFKTEFELIKGRVGKIDFDYETKGLARSTIEMIARISGIANDDIRINEKAHLAGEAARAVLKSYIALRDDSRAEVNNTLRADAPHARGHVDCKEIVQGRALARAVPIVEVNHPTAHVTHEAAIGSVDSKQLQTLQSRGLSEDEAVEIIIQGLLS